MARIGHTVRPKGPLFAVHKISQQDEARKHVVRIAMHYNLRVVSAK
jgi:hypothetical protein